MAKNKSSKKNGSSRGRGGDSKKTNPATVSNSNTPESQNAASAEASEIEKITSKISEIRNQMQDTFQSLE